MFEGKCENKAKMWPRSKNVQVFKIYKITKYAKNDEIPKFTELLGIILIFSCHYSPSLSLLLSNVVI